MTQTIAAQLDEIARSVNAIAAVHRNHLALAAVAWALDDAANLAQGRLRHLLNVPPGTVAEPTALTSDQSAEPDRDSEAAADIVRCVKANPGITTPGIIAATGYSRSYTQVMLKRMVSERRMRRSGHKPGSPARWWLTT